MNEKISVLIADDNIDFGNMLNEYINLENGINVVGVARDGIEAVNMIDLYCPDVVVLDIIMPNLDGIGVLEKLRSFKLSKKPLIIVLTAIGQDSFIQRAIALGADYYIVKPFDIDLLVSRIRQVFNDKNSLSVIQKQESGNKSQTDNRSVLFDNDLERIVTDIIREVGIPPHIIGYQYLREAVILNLKNDDVFCAVTKVIYPAVAKKYLTSPQKVERAIRNAIEIAWQRGNPDSMDALFGYNISFNKGKPTNSEFIAMIAEKIKMSTKQKK